MKKLQKLSLKQLKQKATSIGSNDQRCILGGDYSFSTYENMCSSGTWEGGVVEGYGYIGVTCCAFVNPANYQPFSEWSSNNVIGWGDSVAKAVIGEVPFLGTYTSVVEDQYNNELWDINTALLNAGLSGSDGIYSIYDDNSMRFYIYDQDGEFLYGTPSD